MIGVWGFIICWRNMGKGMKETDAGMGYPAAGFPPFFSAANWYLHTNAYLHANGNCLFTHEWKVTGENPKRNHVLHIKQIHSLEWHNSTITKVCQLVSFRRLLQLNSGGNRTQWSCPRRHPIKKIQVLNPSCVSPSVLSAQTWLESAVKETSWRCLRSSESQTRVKQISAHN